MHEAVVDWFNDDKGYGFVVMDGGDSAYVHRSAIPGDGYRYLVGGERVLVTVGPGKDNRPAVSELAFPADRLTGTVKDYNDQRGFGLITRDDDGEDIFFHFTGVLRDTSRVKLDAGDQVMFSVVFADGKDQAREVKAVDPRSRFGQFTFLHDNDYADLAELAEPEDWSGAIDSEGSDDDFRLLRNYIKYTFLRLEEEQKIVHATTDNGEEVAAFNTGLVTPNQQEIYGFFRAQPQHPIYQYALVDWIRDSDNRIAGLFDPRPQLASYWSNPIELYFDPSLPIILDTEHFVEENLSRFPQMFQEHQPLAIAATNAAKEQAVMRAKRNYKTAVPMFHRGETQLLLPLSLDGTGKAQLALVIKRVNNEYIGETVLTLQQALNNARLLARPDRDWLNQ